MKSRKARMKIRITKHKINNGRSIKPVLIKFNGRYCKLTRGNELLERVSELSVKFCLNFSCGKCISVSTTVPISLDGWMDRSIDRSTRGEVLSSPSRKKKNSRATRETRIMESFISRHPVLGWLLHFLRREDTIPREGILKRAINSVYETWQGRGMDLVEKFSIRLPPPSEFPIQLRSIRNLFILCHVPHSTC